MSIIFPEELGLVDGVNSQLAVSRKRHSTSSSIQLGLIPFSEARRVQEDFHAKRRRGDCGDLVLFCEHPPTLSLGKRATANDIGLSASAWAEKGVELVRTSRGGSVSYHGPGQLVIYPVVSLRDKGLGVKSFVVQGLELISDVLKSFGLVCDYDCRENPGVWIDGKKIASVGFQIRNGVSLHGWSLNIDCELEPFSYFDACGIRGCRVTSVYDELAISDREFTALKARLLDEIENAFTSTIS